MTKRESNVGRKLAFLCALATVATSVAVIGTRVTSRGNGDGHVADQVRSPEGAERSVEITDTGLFLDQASATSVRSLVRESDIVAIGTITRQDLIARPQAISVPLKCTPTAANAGKECPSSLSGTVGYYLTNYLFKVDRYLKNGSGPDLVIQEVGGVVDGVRIIAHEWPSYEAGQRYLIFMKRDSKKSEIVHTTAAVLGGFEVIGGQLRRLPGARDYQGGASAALEGQAEPDAVGQITAALTETG